MSAPFETGRLPANCPSCSAERRFLAWESQIGSDIPDTLRYLSEATPKPMQTILHGFPLVLDWARNPCGKGVAHLRRCAACRAWGYKCPLCFGCNSVGSFPTGTHPIVKCGRCSSTILVNKICAIESQIECPKCHRRFWGSVYGPAQQLATAGGAGGGAIGGAILGAAVGGPPGAVVGLLVGLFGGAAAATQAIVSDHVKCPGCFHSFKPDG